jgi:hypothetical protein
MHASQPAKEKFMSRRFYASAPTIGAGLVIALGIGAKVNKGEIK